MSMPRIRIVATGGTIAGAGSRPQSTQVYASGALDVKDLCAAVPGLNELAQVETEQFAALDSKNATPAFWRALAVRLQELLDSEAVDGLVVTHGTDTLEETAYYLHLVLKTRKPVVLVGAMRPATALSPDGPLNLFNAVTVAAAAEAADRGVLIAFNHGIFGARDATKVNANRPDAFAAPNGGPLGLVQDGCVSWLARPDRMHTHATRFSCDTPLPPVEVLVGYAGASAALIDAVGACGARGLIWAGTGNGSASKEALAALDRLRAAGLAVVRTTRTGSGCIPAGQGMVGAGTLSPWKARVLTMLALGAGCGEPQLLQSVFDTH
ncbi:MAG: asparaginase [Pigmentiphaga sp.]|uniref:asparaginase n=1 Tax=Pigmentiphaga sp. TaxID=1977564 RepID=UPI0029BCCD1C|nr:asparaginase [Pigmentiphaga sp.]MDX3905412.1 asparaginase [Pigmentiphaga sp.]